MEKVKCTKKTMTWIWWIEYFTFLLFTVVIAYTHNIYTGKIVKLYEEKDFKWKSTVVVVTISKWSAKYNVADVKRKQWRKKSNERRTNTENKMCAFISMKTLNLQMLCAKLKTGRAGKREGGRERESLRKV